MSVRAVAARCKAAGGRVGNCIAGEMPTAVARNLREIVLPDLPNERHRDFVNHSQGTAAEGEGGRPRRRVQIEARCLSVRE